MNKISILLVEDSPDHEYLALRIIKKSKLSDNLNIVRDGQDALDYLYYEGKYSNRPVSKPHLILLDLSLPKIDGLDVLKKIRATKSTKDIPVIVLSSSQISEDIKTCHLEGIHCSITKPITLENFSYAIDPLLAGWASLNNVVE
jgi:CheY-like chemotaxis protein